MEHRDEPLRDGVGRRVEYIRVSLTERCNFRCPFCMPPGDGGEADCRVRLSGEELLRLCRIFSRLGVGNFKITGGEPFMHPEAVRVMAKLKAEAGARCVTVTTNGSTLDRHAMELAAAGIDGVNVSVNAMTEASFAAVTGGGSALAPILDNILLARRLGLRVKLNMVPMLGVNDADIAPLVEFALEHGLTVRFIELMPLGQGRNYRGLSRDEVRRIIESRFGRMELASGRFGNGPAVYYRLEGREIPIGYIAAVSQRFCAACNRLRLASTGFLRTCLHHDHGIDLAAPLRNGETDAEIARRIRSAVADKPVGHRFDMETVGVETGDVPMFRIGG